MILQFQDIIYINYTLYYIHDSETYNFYEGCPVFQLI